MVIKAWLSGRGYRGVVPRCGYWLSGRGFQDVVTRVWFSGCGYQASVGEIVIFCRLIISET